MRKKYWTSAKDTNTAEQERGNALIYVLVAIALFAALGFTLSRQTSNSGGTDELSAAKAEMMATQLITYANQAKAAVDQMMFTGTTIDDLIFTQPGEAGFNIAPHIHKVYHPQGGGLTQSTIPSTARAEISTNPVGVGWYMGRFNNVEWTDSTQTDVILTAYQISEPVCAALNKLITGDDNIPALSSVLHEPLLESGSDIDLTSAICSKCEGYMSLCVANDAETAYGFYNIIADR